MAFQTEGRDGTEIRHKQYGADEWRRADMRPPYFYVDADEGYALPPGVSGWVDRSVEPLAYDGTELHRVHVDSARDTRAARDAAENHYEADIPYVRRFFIDEVDGSMTGGGDINDRRPHIVHIDIETGTSGGGVDALAAMDPVVSVSMYSERDDRHTDMLLWPPTKDAPDPDGVSDAGNPYFEPDWEGAKDGRVTLFNDEAEMLSTLASAIKGAGVEVLTGWNVESFDIAYLIERMSGLDGCDPDELSPLGESYTSSWTKKSGREEINATIKGVDVFDMADAYRHLKRRDKPPNWKLGTVAEYEGTEVKKIPFDTSRVTDAWERDPMEVMEYNRRDAVLTHHVGESMSVFDLFLEIQRAFAMPLPDTLKNSVLVEMYVMSRAPDWGIEERILDSKRTATNDFEGGNTKQPNEGLYEWVFSVDVTSEYPNWVRAANLSPETVVLEDDPEWGRDDLIDTPHEEIKFLPHDEKLGILPRAVDEMFGMKQAKTDKRAQHEYGTDAYEQADLERDTTKWFLNSIQGVTGMETHRLSKNEVSAAITSFGRETVEFMKDVGEDEGYEFVYADTDSVFMNDPSGSITTVEQVVDAVTRLNDRVNERLPVWASDTYGIGPEHARYLEVEPDKVAKKAFFPNKKKRYTLWLVWDDGDEIDKISHTGWAIVRSDTSDAEHRVQKKTLEALIHDKGEDYITERIGEELRDVVEGEYEPIELARPQGSSKPFEAYSDGEGFSFDGVPYFVSAMVSANELLGANHRGGDKAWMLPVEPTETVEVNGSENAVNYLAIDEDTDLPDWVQVDYAKVTDDMIGKVERIYRSLGWDYGRLKEKRADALGVVEVRRTQEQNHTLGGFTS